VLAARMAVPEAPVDEDAHPQPRERKIRPSREIAPVQPKPVAKAVEEASDQELRLGIAPPHGGHHAASSFGRNDVHVRQYGEAVAE
jgi:hypothetical protein